MNNKFFCDKCDKPYDKMSRVLIVPPINYEGFTLNKKICDECLVKLYEWLSQRS